MSAITFDFSLKDVDALVDKYDYEGQNESNPPSEEILWTDWSGGTATRGLRYRAWRIDGVNDDIDKTNTDFSVYLQVEVSSKDKLDVRFTGLFQKDGEDWYAIREGWALGNLYGRRTNFVLLIPGNAAQISYTFEGKWARGSK
ncbi:hypothetical protein Cob_v013136 [Colletotrichum orbiculare MAFF 240422]|uniref:Uncharacterized protein n=1 Tax=Colletotrichum orbiculare (strain 104-T / ATCC 96160 / CBS 514.97 / LARS 414 / MAFF 240422) TaxID=1213857 RepID=A0A484F7M6_COLOR|nr:hypothetical protein Cob_v013136 [Colletotrichum orbiculare MAFF 240422]